MPVFADPELRSAQSRVAALAQHAAGRTNTAPARAKFEQRFRREVLEHAAEHGEQLTEREIERRTEARRKLYYARLTFKSLRARARKRGDGE